MSKNDYIYLTIEPGGARGWMPRVRGIGSSTCTLDHSRSESEDGTYEVLVVLTIVTVPDLFSAEEKLVSVVGTYLRR